MRRTTILILAAGATLAAACTQDFGQFSVGEVGGAGTGTGTGTTTGTGTGTETGNPEGGGGTGGTAAGVGGSATGGGGQGGGIVPECGDEPDPPGGDCDLTLCTNGCEDNLCAIDCDADPDACAGPTIACPAGFECLVLCADGLCDGVTIACPEIYACTITCPNNQCDTVTVTGKSGTVTLSCAGSPNTCAGATLDCGTGQCDATCGGMEGPVTTNCGPSCECNDGC